MTEDALYLKVVSHICDKIIKQELNTGSILNKYEYAFDNGVSKHVVARAFDYLIEKGVLVIDTSNQFSVAESALPKARAYRKEKVLTQELYTTFELLSLLTISAEEFNTAYQHYSALKKS
jgi:DNA-binding transcriptional regulator YhcF (GntR family)